MKIIDFLTILFILAIPIIFYYSIDGIVPICKGGEAGMEFLHFLIFLPILSGTELILFFLTRFLINKFFQKKLKEYKIALGVSGIFLILLFFTIPTFQNAIAYFTTNINFCKEPCRDDCIHTVVLLKKHDESLCELINEISEKGSCYYDVAAIKGDVRLCRHTKGYIDIPECYFGVSNHGRDLNVCEKFEEEHDKEKCYDIIYEEMAYYNNNSEFCGKIKDRALRAVCYYNVSQQRKK